MSEIVKLKELKQHDIHSLSLGDGEDSKDCNNSCSPRIRSAEGKYNEFNDNTINTSLTTKLTKAKPIGIKKAAASRPKSSPNIPKVQVNGKNFPINSKEKLCNNSRSMKSSQKVKIISSKYKQAATDFVQRNQSGNNSGNLSSPSFNAAKNSSIASQRSTTGLKRNLAASAGNLSRPNPLPSKMKEPYSSANSKSPYSTKTNTKKSTSTNVKLHSTAIYNNTVLEDTRIDNSDRFSTTVVTRDSKRNLVMSIPDISSISTIGSDGSFCENSPSNMMLPISELDEDVFEENLNESILEMEYLKYLMWTHVDLRHEAQMKKEEQELKRQLMFLASMVEKEQNELLEKEKLIALIAHHNEVDYKFHDLEITLHKLNENLKLNGVNMEILSTNLESKLNELKFENVFIPEEKEAFTEKLMNLLKTNSKLKHELNTLLEPRRAADESLINLFKALEEAGGIAQPCFTEVEKSASLSIQEASLRLTLEALEIENETKAT